MTYSHMANATLPSAMLRFTSEFGKGSGGSTALLSSGKGVDDPFAVCNRFIEFVNEVLSRQPVGMAYSISGYATF